jgi:DNA-binding CsgD family transcriptional regulator
VTVVAAEGAPMLSARELQTLVLVAKGFDYDEIARLHAISRQTVLTYVKRIFRKLQVRSKTEAVYEARQLGLVRD